MVLEEDVVYYRGELAKWSNARAIDLEVAGSNLAFERTFFFQKIELPPASVAGGKRPFDNTATLRKCIAIKYVRFPHKP